MDSRKERSDEGRKRGVNQAGGFKWELQFIGFEGAKQERSEDGGVFG